MPGTFTQPSSVYVLAPNTAALDFTFDDEIAIIPSEIYLESQNGVGVYSNNKLNQTLINSGTILANSSIGVELDGPTASVTNMISGLIFGNSSGILLLGSSSQIVNNFGHIIGAVDAGVHFSGGPFLINNHGSIYSFSFGIAAQELGNGVINNFGIIKADDVGSVAIRVQPLLASTMVEISNSANGVISGAFYAVQHVFGEMSLINRGKIIGEIRDFSGTNDHIVNHGLIRGETLLGGGDDVFQGAGGRCGSVFGEDGDDRLTGGKATDRLYGGDGSDSLTGGLGADQFFFDTALNGSVDKITDFTPAQHDKIVLWQAVFSGVGPVGGTLAANEFHKGIHATTTSQHILYTPRNGFLYYDQDGSGTTYAPIHFATLFSTPTTHPSITHSSFLLEA